MATREESGGTGAFRARLRGLLGLDEEGVSLALVLLSGAIAAAVLSPLLWLFWRANEVPLADAVFLLTSSTATEVLSNSLLLVALVTGASIVLGVPLAVLTVQTDLPFRRFWTVVIALPLVVPSYIGAFAYVSAFGPSGALADLLAPWGIGVPTVYGLPGAALVLTLFVYPYVFLTTRASLLSFDETQLEAARTLNHSYPAAFKRVILPQVAPAVTAGALLVALYTLSDFGTPAIMRYDVFTRVIYVELNSFGAGRSNATLLSLQLLTVTAVVLALESRVGGANTSGYGAPASSTPMVSLGRLRWVATLLPVTVSIFTLVLPVGILTVWLLRSGPGYQGGGLAFQPAFALNSVYVAAIAAFVTLLFALPIAYYAGRSDSAFARGAERATYLGYAMPGVVLGLSLVFFSSNWLSQHVSIEAAQLLYQSLPLLVFAYVVRFLPQAVGSTRSSVLGVDRERHRRRAGAGRAATAGVPAGNASPHRPGTACRGRARVPDDDEGTRHDLDSAPDRVYNTGDLHLASTGSGLLRPGGAAGASAGRALGALDDPASQTGT
jgi:ABC-type Fe3+ transport system, permease component